ncbi:MAG: hypothetical protein EGQ34_04115 [Sutterella sp.]|nr:hypothetical protein [Sutterella sp.]
MGAAPGFLLRAARMRFPTGMQMKKEGMAPLRHPLPGDPKTAPHSRGRHCTRPEARIHEADPWLLEVDQAVLLEMKYASYENDSQ